MKVDLQKIRVAGLKKHYKILMQELHKKGILHIVARPDLCQNEKIDDHFGVFDLARIDFAINFLEKFEPKKSAIEKIFGGGKIFLTEKNAKNRLENFAKKSDEIISECEKIEEFLAKSKNEILKIKNKKKILENVKNLDGPILENFSTDLTKSWIGAISKNNAEKFAEKIAEISNLIDTKILSENARAVFFRVTASKNLEKKIAEILQKFSFSEINFSELAEFFGENPREILQNLEKKEKNLAEKILECEQKLKNFAKNLDDFRILRDYNFWRKRKNELQKKIYYSEKIFAFEAFVPKKKFAELEKWTQNAFVGEILFEKTEIEKNEEAPVLLQNPIWVRSFEPIIDMFGLPKKKEFDPTFFMTPFFLIFFGTCLSDVGYGAILILAATIFLLFGKFSLAARDGLRLILMSGFFAIIGGILLGSYFGMTPEQAPNFLLVENWRDAATPFRGQILDPMKGAGPLNFLIISVTFGAVQLLFGLIISFWQKIFYRDFVGAFCDSLGWFFFVLFLILFGISDLIGIDKNLMGNSAIGAAIFLILTQGRDQKNWLLKPISGILSLFGITGYLSDLLSYSRLMALGLATGVVGYAMNLTATILSGMIPNKIASIILMIVVLIAGHSLNFGLSLLGAFIHSGRLQFIEFFGKFYEGGAKKFIPFFREKKYLSFLKEEK